MPDELPDNSEESPEETEPLNVKITNQAKSKPAWNDSKDDVEYESLNISDEDMNI